MKTSKLLCLYTIFWIRLRILENGQSNEHRINVLRNWRIECLTGAGRAYVIESIRQASEQKGNILIFTFTIEKDHTYYHTQRMVVKLVSWSIPGEASQVLSHPDASQNHRRNTQDLNGSNTNNEHKRWSHRITIQDRRCHRREIYCSRLLNVEFDRIWKKLEHL